MVKVTLAQKDCQDENTWTYSLSQWSRSGWPSTQHVCPIDN